MQLNAICNREEVALRSIVSRLPWCNFRSKHPRSFTQTFRIMRITAIFLIAFALQVSARGLSQTISISGSNLPLGKVFNAIKKQTGYVVFYDQRLINQRVVSLNVKNIPLESFMQLVLKDASLSYSFEDKTIVISRMVKKEKVSVPIVDTIPVSKAQFLLGTLINELGEPVPSAAVLILPLNKYAVSDEHGIFRFPSLLPGPYTLVVTHVSYEKTEKSIKVSKSPVKLEISLRMATSVNEEVLVSTGYQKLKKGASTGSYSVVSAKEIEQTPAINLMERLEGKVPGVLFDVRNNKIQVRGVNTFGTNPVAPLIVVDGFPYIDQQLTNITSTNFTTSNSSTNPLNSQLPAYAGSSILSSFNPSDIESITFLKDAASSSIWGSQAANGVIVIETKKGRHSVPTVNLSTTVSISAPADFSQVDKMSSRDYVNLEKEMFNKNFFSDPTGGYRYAAISEAQEWMFRVKRGTATAAQRDSALEVLSNRSNDSQLKQYLLQKTVTQQYNLSVSGGGGNTSYHISGNYTKMRPVFKSNQSESYFVTSNTSTDFLDKRLTLNTGLNYTYSQETMNSASAAGLSQGSLGLAPYDLLVDANGKPIERGLTFTKHVSDSLTSLGQLSWTYNPIDELNYNNSIYTKHAIRANLSLIGKITNWANIQVSGQLQRNIDEQDNLQDLNSISTRQLVNEGTTIVNGKLVYGVPKGGIYKSSNTNSEDYGLRAQFNIYKSWNKIHQFIMLAGSEIRQSKGTGYTQTRYGYDPILSTSVVVNPTVSYTTMYGTTKTLGYSDGTIYKSRQRYLSYFSNAGYTLMNKYYVSASLRFDDASTIGVSRSQRATPLWSTGAKWDITKEKFMTNIHWLNNLALRATYGTGGSLPTGAAAHTIVSVGGTDSYTQLPYAYISTPGNPTLTWQTTKTFNTGIDADLFNNRLSVSLDVYNKRSYNIYYNFVYNSTYGFSTLGYNTSSLKSHGIEVNLTGQIIRLKNWQWTSNFNLSYNTNEVTDNRFPNNTTQVGNAAIITVGYPTDNFFVYRWAGLDNTGQSQIYNASGTKLTANTYPTIKPEDRVYAGRTTAPYFGGFTNTLQYKNWTFSVRAVYYMGHKFLKQDINSNAYPSGSSWSGNLATSKALVRRWQNPGDEAVTDVPGLSNISFNSISWFNNSDRAVRDASNIRLQQITLGYSMPSSVLKKLYVFKSATLSGTVSNLGIIWRKNKEGIDPNYVVTGNYNNLPPSANYVLNLNLNF